MQAIKNEESVNPLISMRRCSFASVVPAAIVARGGYIRAEDCSFINNEVDVVANNFGMVFSNSELSVQTTGSGPAQAPLRNAQRMPFLQAGDPGFELLRKVRRKCNTCVCCDFLAHRVQHMSLV